MNTRQFIINSPLQHRTVPSSSLPSDQSRDNTEAVAAGNLLSSYPPGLHLCNQGSNTLNFHRKLSSIDENDEKHLHQARQAIKETQSAAQVKLPAQMADDVAQSYCQTAEQSQDKLQMIPEYSAGDLKQNPERHAQIQQDDFSTKTKAVVTQQQQYQSSNNQKQQQSFQQPMQRSSLNTNNNLSTHQHSTELNQINHSQQTPSAKNNYLPQYSSNNCSPLQSDNDDDDSGSSCSSDQNHSSPQMLSSRSKKQRRVTITCDKGRFVKHKEEISHSKYRKITRGYDNESGCEVAWSSYSLQKITNQQKLELLQILDTVKQVQHDHILQVTHFELKQYEQQSSKPGFISKKSSLADKTSLQSDNTTLDLVVITELITAGSIREYLRKIQSPRLKVIKKWCKRVLEGISYMHSMDVMHGNLTCESIYINSNNGDIKVGDIGYRYISKYAQKVSEMARTKIYKKEQNQKSFDIYCLGLVLLEMISAISGPHTFIHILRIIEKGGKQKILDSILDPLMKDFFILTLQEEPENRASLKDLANHQFFEHQQNDKKSVLETNNLYTLIEESRQSIKSAKFTPRHDLSYSNANFSSHFDHTMMSQSIITSNEPKDFKLKLHRTIEEEEKKQVVQTDDKQENVQTIKSAQNNSQSGITQKQQQQQPCENIVTQTMSHLKNITCQFQLELQTLDKVKVIKFLYDFETDTVEAIIKELSEQFQELTSQQLLTLTTQLQSIVNNYAKNSVAYQVQELVKDKIVSEIQLKLDKDNSVSVLSQDCALDKLKKQKKLDSQHPIELSLNRRRLSPDLPSVMEEDAMQQLLQESATPTKHLNQLSQAEYQTIDGDNDYLKSLDGINESCKSQEGGSLRHNLDTSDDAIIMNAQRSAVQFHNNTIGAMPNNHMKQKHQEQALQCKQIVDEHCLLNSITYRDQYLGYLGPLMSIEKESYHQDDEEDNKDMHNLLKKLFPDYQKQQEENNARLKHYQNDTVNLSIHSLDLQNLINHQQHHEHQQQQHLHLCANSETKCLLHGEGSQLGKALDLSIIKFDSCGQNFPYARLENEKDGADFVSDSSCPCIYDQFLDGLGLSSLLHDKHQLTHLNCNNLVNTNSHLLQISSSFDSQGMMHGFKNHLREKVSVLPSGESHQTIQAIQTSSGSTGLQINKILMPKKKIEEQKQQKSIAFNSNNNNNEVMEVASSNNGNRTKPNGNDLYAMLDDFKVPMKSEKLQRRYKQMYCEDIKLLKRALKIIYGGQDDTNKTTSQNNTKGAASTAEISSTVSCSDTMSNSAFHQSNKTNTELLKDYTIDGHYCHMTKILVIKQQTEHQQQMVPDGIVTPELWNIIMQKVRNLLKKKIDEDQSKTCMLNELLSEIL